MDAIAMNNSVMSLLLEENSLLLEENSLLHEGSSLLLEGNRLLLEGISLLLEDNRLLLEENNTLVYDTITNSQDHQVTASSNKRKVTEDDRKGFADSRYRKIKKEEFEKSKVELCLILEQKIAHLQQENARLEKEAEKAKKDGEEVRIPNVEQGVVIGHVQAGSKASDRVPRSEELNLEEALLLIKKFEQEEKEMKALNNALLDRLVTLESMSEMQKVESSSSCTGRDHSTM